MIVIAALPGHARAGAKQGGSWLGRGRVIQGRAICYQGGGGASYQFRRRAFQAPLRGTGPLYTPLTRMSSHFRNFFLFFLKHIDSAFLEHCIATRCDDTFLFLLVAFSPRPGLLRRIGGLAGGGAVGADGASADRRTHTRAPVHTRIRA